MKQHGKKYRAAFEKIEPGRKYNLDSAITKLKEIAFAKFDETVELTVWLGVDPRKADQLVRGTIVLPPRLTLCVWWASSVRCSDRAVSCLTRRPAPSRPTSPPRFAKRRPVKSSIASTGTP